MGIFRNRLPESKDLFVIFGVVLFAVFSWSIRGFLFVFPSIVMYYDGMAVLAIFFYMMAIALVESTLVLVGLIVLSAILPVKWFREGFAYKGFLTILIGSIAAIRYQAYLGEDIPEWSFYLLWGTIFIFVLVGLIWLFQKVRYLRELLLPLVDRFSVFNYLYLPLGILGVMVVFVRNVF